MHKKSVEFIKGLKAPLWSTWPVITEASHMLDFSVQSQSNLLEWIRRGGLKIFDLKSIHLTRLIDLSQKFQEVPVDLADASLIVGLGRA